MKQGVAVICITWLLIACGEEVVQQAPPPKIQVVQVQVDDVQLEKDFVGSVYGKVDIPIRARVEGFLEGIHFQEGEPVRKGQLLYTIDAQPFEASLAQAKSQLAEAKINLVKAQNDLNRIQPLAEMKAVSESDLDAALAQKGAAEAAVEAAEASVRIEEIQLSYTRITSPINGLIGKTQAKIGEFVGRDPSSSILNTVSRIDSIRVEFFLNENDYLVLARKFLDTADSTTSDRDNPLRLLLADGSLFDQVGEVDFVDRGIDATTGAILIQATFPNPRGLIRPGQFARVRAVIREVDQAILIPQRCVSEFQGRYNVMVVDTGNRIAQRQVELIGPYRDYYLIQTGLKPKEQVVLEGLQKISEGMQIDPQPAEFKSQYTEKAAP